MYHYAGRKCSSVHPAVEQQFQYTEPQICKNPQCKTAGDFAIMLAAPARAGKYVIFVWLLLVIPVVDVISFFTSVKLGAFTAFIKGF